VTSSRCSKRRATTILLLLALGASTRVGAADRFFIYNLTTSTEFTGVFLAPAGTENWGANQALNDKDKSLETSERLPLTGISHGMFDVKLQDRKGHVCVKHGVDLARDTSFDVRDADLAACR
jgi:hypothetical protein